MSKAPSMPMYWDAYLADTTHLTTEEHGAYLLLLGAMWRRNGMVPDDDKDNARILGLTKAKWLKIKYRLSSFLIYENNHILQKKLQKTWKKTQETIQKNRENGSKGGRPVSNKNNDLAKAVGSISHNPNKTIPEPEPLPKEKYIKKDLLTDLLEEDFNEFWKTCLRKDAKAQTFVNYKKARKKSSKEIIHNSMIAYSQKCEAEKTETKYIKKPNNWLTAEMYLDDHQADSNEDYINVPESEWSTRVKIFRTSGQWHDEWGPDPDQKKNNIPDNILIANNYPEAAQ